MEPVVAQRKLTAEERALAKQNAAKEKKVVAASEKRERALRAQHDVRVAAVLADSARQEQELMRAVKQERFRELHSTMLPVRKLTSEERALAKQNAAKEKKVVAASEKRERALRAQHDLRVAAVLADTARQDQELMRALKSQ